jgi:hypothetical protein
MWPGAQPPRSRAAGGNGRLQHVRSNESTFGETEVVVAADHDVIKDADIDQRKSLLQSTCQSFVRAAGHGIFARMVVASSSVLVVPAGWIVSTLSPLP